MLTQHEIFAFITLLATTIYVLMRAQGLVHARAIEGAFTVTGMGTLGLLAVLEVVFLLGGLGR